MHGMELVSTSWGPVGVEETGEVPWNCPWHRADWCEGDV